MSLNKFMENLFREQQGLFRQKAEQYSNGDELANFRTGARLMFEGEDDYESMYAAASNFMCKHVAHVYNHGIDGPKVDESLRDIINYCGIMLYMREQHRRGKAVGSEQKG